MQQGTATRRKVGGGSNGASASSPPASTSVAPSSTPVATVKRRKFGTSPFDEHWLNVDCCGLFCALLTYGLHFYGFYAVCWIIIPPWMSETTEEHGRQLTLAGHLNCALFGLVAALACFAHLKAMTTDPGAVPPDAKPLPEPQEETIDQVAGQTQSQPPQQQGLLDADNNKNDTAPKKKPIRMCRRCNAFKPKRAHHCSVCKRCIVKMDHHCPWVNNCVGIGNHKYFLLFVFYTALSCLYSLSLLAIRFFACATATRTHLRGAAARQSGQGHCLDEPTHLFYVMLLLVEAILFGLFTCCMKIDQFDVVMSNMTHIDKLKGQYDPLASRLGQHLVPGVTEVFGVGKRGGGAKQSKFRMDWVSPFARVCFSESLRDDIFGYCRPRSSNRGVHKKQSSGTIGEQHDASMELLPLNNNTTSGNSAGRMVRSVAEIV